jgi:hypothetical protein
MMLVSRVQRRAGQVSTPAASRYLATPSLDAASLAPCGTTALPTGKAKPKFLWGRIECPL